ncbi:MAG: hypothetical protein WBB52_12780 [Acidimicrobiales bacterium]
MTSEVVTTSSPNTRRLDAVAPWRDRRTIGYIVAATAVFALLAVWSRPHEYWLDEAYSLAAAPRPWTSIRGEHGTMSAFYVMIAGWTRVSTSPWWIRALPIVTMATALITFTLLTVRQFGRAVGARAGILAASAYIVVDLGNEIRSYALVSLIVVTSWAALDHGIASPTQRRWWVLHAGCCVLLPFTHGLAMMQLGAQALALLASRPGRPCIQRALAGYGAGGAVLLALVANGLGKEGPANWDPPPKWSDLPAVLSEYSSPVPILALIMATMMIIGAVIATRSAIAASTPLERFRHLQPLAWGVVSFSALLAFSLVHNHLIPRYTTASAFGFSLLLAIGAERLDRPMPRIPLATIALLITSLIGIAILAEREPRAWTNAITYLEAESAPGDAIIFPTDDVRLPFEANWNRDDRATELELLGTGEQLGTLRRYGPPRTIDDLVAATADADRIWVVNQGYAHVPDQTPAFLAAMAPEFEAVTDESFGRGVSITLLQRSDLGTHRS